MTYCALFIHLVLTHVDNHLFLAVPQSLPDFLANRLLARLLQTGSVTPVHLPLFAPCATIVRIPATLPVNDGGAWLGRPEPVQVTSALPLQPASVCMLRFHLAHAKSGTWAVRAVEGSIMSACARGAAMRR